MSDSDNGPGRREVAHRLFATEYDDASLEYSESDEERAPNYIVTPTGARVNRLFVVGVLTAVESVNEDTVRARIVDPTGAFVVYAGQYQPDELAFFERAEPPMFVAVTGKANAFQPEDSDRVLTSVRPESVNEVDEDTRDRWVVTTAEHTLERIGALADALSRDASGERLRTALTDDGYDPAVAAAIDLAIDHYDTSADYLGRLQEVAVDAASVIAGERDEVPALDHRPDEQTGAFDSAVLAERLPNPVGVTTIPDSEPSVAADPTATDTSDRDSDSPSSAADSDEPTTGVTEPDDAAEAVVDDTATATDDGEADRAPTTATEPVEQTADTEPSEATASESADPDSHTDENDEVDTEQDDEPESVSDEFEGSEAIGSTESTSSLGNFDEGDDQSTAAGDIPQTDEMYEFDEDEREQVKEEHGLEFSTGTEVDTGERTSEEPTERDDGEETSDPEVDDAPVDEPTDEATTADETEASSQPAGDESDAPADDEEAPGANASVDDVLIDTMEELDDGDGADRAAVIDAVVETTGGTQDAVEDAIEDALMSGKCYEPDDNSLKPI